MDRKGKVRKGKKKPGKEIRGLKSRGVEREEKDRRGQGRIEMKWEWKDRKGKWSGWKGS